MNYKPEDFLNTKGTLKKYIRSNSEIDFDTRVSIKCNSRTKKWFKACCEFLQMDEPDILDILFKDFVQKVVEYADE